MWSVNVSAYARLAAYHSELRQIARWHLCSGEGRALAWKSKAVLRSECFTFERQGLDSSRYTVERPPDEQHEPQSLE